VAVSRPNGPVNRRPAGGVCGEVGTTPRVCVCGCVRVCTAQSVCTLVKSIFMSRDLFAAHITFWIRTFFYRLLSYLIHFIFALFSLCIATAELSD